MEGIDFSWIWLFRGFESKLLICISPFWLSVFILYFTNQAIFEGFFGLKSHSWPMLTKNCNFRSLSCFCPDICAIRPYKIGCYSKLSLWRSSTNDLKQPKNNQIPFGRDNQVFTTRLSLKFLFMLSKRLIFLWNH